MVFGDVTTTTGGHQTFGETVAKRPNGPTTTASGNGGTTSGNGTPYNREDRKYCYYKVKMEGYFEETCVQVPTGTVAVYPFLLPTDIAITGTGLSCSFVLQNIKVLETCRCVPEGTINCNEYADDAGIFLGDQFLNIEDPPETFPRVYKFTWCAAYQLDICLDPYDCEGTKFTTINEIKLGPFGGDAGSCRSPGGSFSSSLDFWYGGEADSFKCENRLMGALGQYWDKNIKCPILK